MYIVPYINTITINIYISLLQYIVSFTNTIIINTVRTRFVSNHNSVGFARKKVQTISFVERGFERLDLSHQAVGFSWCSHMVKSFSP